MSEETEIGISTNLGGNFWSIRRNLRQLPVHGRGAGLVGGLADLGDLHLQRALPEGDLDHVADLDLIAGPDGAAVDADALAVAGVVGDGAALDEARDF